jgi:hypothetical protein
MNLRWRITSFQYRSYAVEPISARRYAPLKRAGGREEQQKIIRGLCICVVERRNASQHEPNERTRSVMLPNACVVSPPFNAGCVSQQRYKKKPSSSQMSS